LAPFGDDAFQLKLLGLFQQHLRFNIETIGAANINLLDHFTKESLACF
jgi:hypothetical protein